MGSETSENGFEAVEHKSEETELSDAIIDSGVVANVLAAHYGTDVTTAQTVVRDSEYRKGLSASLFFRVEASSRSPSDEAEIRRTITLIVKDNDGVIIPCDLRWSQPYSPWDDPIFEVLVPGAEMSVQSKAPLPRRETSVTPSSRAFGAIVVEEARKRSDKLENYWHSIF